MADLIAHFRPSSNVRTQGDFGEGEGGIVQEKLRLMRREVTVVTSRNFLFAIDDQTSIINFKPVSVITGLPLHGRLSHNLHSNNVLHPEERGFKKGMCVEIATFTLTGMY